jgi:hypothetical protein
MEASWRDSRQTWRATGGGTWPENDSVKRREWSMRFLHRMRTIRGVEILHIFRRSSMGRSGKRWNSVSVDGASFGGGWGL